jgi:hypothetical protein
MAYADPQSVTISGTAISLPRVSTGENKSSYKSSDGLVQLSASSSYGNRNRRVLRLDHSKIVANPYSSLNELQSMSNYIVFDAPVVGYTNADILAVYAGFKTAFTASTDLLISKLLGGES